MTKARARAIVGFGLGISRPRSEQARPEPDPTTDHFAPCPFQLPALIQHHTHPPSSPFTVPSSIASSVVICHSQSWSLTSPQGSLGSKAPRLLQPQSYSYFALLAAVASLSPRLLQPRPAPPSACWAIDGRSPGPTH